MPTAIANARPKKKKRLEKRNGCNGRSAVRNTHLRCEEEPEGRMQGQAPQLLLQPSKPFGAQVGVPQQHPRPSRHSRANQGEIKRINASGQKLPRNRKKPKYPHKQLSKSTGCDGPPLEIFYDLPLLGGQMQSPVGHVEALRRSHGHRLHRPRHRARQRIHL